MDLDNLEKLFKKTTQEKWILDIGKGRRRHKIKAGFEIIQDSKPTDPRAKNHVANAEFIVAIHAAFPKILTYIRNLEEQVIPRVEAEDFENESIEDLPDYINREMSEYENDNPGKYY